MGVLLQERARSALALAVCAAGLLAGCATTVEGRAEPADAGPAVPPLPSQTLPADPPPAGAGAESSPATPADVPALVSTVEGMFDALSAGDYEQVCGFLDFGPAGADPLTIGACADGLQEGFESTFGEGSSALRDATREAFASITVDAPKVELSGAEATIPRDAIVSSVAEGARLATSDVRARLTTDGWLIDPFSLQ